MNRGFYLSLMVLIVSVVSVLVYGYRYDSRQIDDSLATIATIAHGVVPALEVAYIEPDAMELFGSSVRANPIYPEMPQINRMGFVYAK